MRRKLSKPKVVPIAGASANVGHAALPVWKMDSGSTHAMSKS
jgi:hypothetical protein